MPPRPRVLIAEDNPDFAEMLAVAVAAAWPPGWEPVDVRVAKDGVRAAAELESFRPDLLITDEKMPGKTGTELCKLVRASPILETTLVVVMTAFYGTAAEQLAFQSGADAFLSKPFDTDELRSTLGRLFGTPGN